MTAGERLARGMPGLSGVGAASGAPGGVVLTVTGVVLAFGRADPVGREGARATGVVFGLAAALCYGVGGFLLGRYTREFGWLVGGGGPDRRDGGAAGAADDPAAPGYREPVRPRCRLGVGAGLVDAAGVVFFARGDQVGLISITAATSSAYPIIPLMGGLVLLHERMAPRQAVGAVLILAGLVLLGAGS